MQYLERLESSCKLRSGPLAVLKEQGCHDSAHVLHSRISDSLKRNIVQLQRRTSLAWDPLVPTDRTLGGSQRQSWCNFLSCRKFPTQLLLNGLPGFFLGARRLGCVVNRSPPSSADIKNGWRYTPPPPMCLYYVSTDNFTFTFFFNLASNWTNTPTVLKRFKLFLLIKRVKKEQNQIGCVFISSTAQLNVSWVIPRTVSRAGRWSREYVWQGSG